MKKLCQFWKFHIFHELVEGIWHFMPDKREDAPIKVTSKVRPFIFGAQVKRLKTGKKNGRLSVHSGDVI